MQRGRAAASGGAPTRELGRVAQQRSVRCFPANESRLKLRRILIKRQRVQRAGAGRTGYAASVFKRLLGRTGSNLESGSDENATDRGFVQLRPGPDFDQPATGDIAQFSFSCIALLLTS